MDLYSLVPRKMVKCIFCSNFISAWVHKPYNLQREDCPVATFSASAWGKMACEGEDLEVEVLETRSQRQGDKTEV